MRKSLEELLIEYANNKQSFKRARGKSQFIGLWPEIRDMLEKGWKLTAICEVLKAHALLDLHYETLRRYIIRKRGLEDRLDKTTSTPGKEKPKPKDVPVQKAEVKKETEDIEKPPYSVPQKFGERYRREDDAGLF